MSRGVLDSTTTAAESPHPATTTRLVIWAAGIGVNGALVLAVVLAVNLVFGGAAAPDPAPEPTSAEVSQAASPTTGPATQPAPKRIRLSAPTRIGNLRKTAVKDFPDLQQRAGRQRIAHPFAAAYTDAADGLLISYVWGGTGGWAAAGAPPARAAALRDATAALVPDARLGAAQTADPGATGGFAECAPVEGRNLPVTTVCSWASEDGVLAVLSFGYDPPTAATLLAALLAALVSG